jgi:hypothetical protein
LCRFLLYINTSWRSIACSALSSAGVNSFDLDGTLSLFFNRAATSISKEVLGYKIKVLIQIILTVLLHIHTQGGQLQWTPGSDSHLLIIMFKNDKISWIQWKKTVWLGSSLRGIA